VAPHAPMAPASGRDPFYDIRYHYGLHAVATKRKIVRPAVHTQHSAHNTQAMALAVARGVTQQTPTVP
jgi:hypothetical protein